MRTYKKFDFEPNQYPNKAGFCNITKDDFKRGIYNPEFDVDVDGIRMANSSNITQTIID